VIASGETATFVVLGRLVTAGDEGIDPRSLTVVDGPGSGTARAVDGRIVYTPAPFWLGKESLTYRVCDTTGDRNGCARATLEVTTTRRVETVEVALRGQPRHEFGVGNRRNPTTARFQNVTVCDGSEPPSQHCLVTRLGGSNGSRWLWDGPPGRVPGGYPFVLVVHVDSWADGDGKPGPTGIRYELRLRFTHQGGGSS
jgi:hypothetical protein